MNNTFAKMNNDSSSLMEEFPLDYQAIKKASEVFRAVNNSFRQQILQQLNLSKKLTVTELYIKLKVDQSVVSQHLSILRNASIVITKRAGKNIFYSINYPKVERLNQLAEQIPG